MSFVNKVLQYVGHDSYEDLAFSSMFWAHMPIHFFTIKVAVRLPFFEMFAGVDKTKKSRTRLGAVNN